MPPIYDDVGYLLDAYQRLAFEGVNSLFALVQSFRANPPHAPMSTLTAMVGYSLFGAHVWAPYFSNIWILATYAASVYFVARSYLQAVPSVLLVALMLYVPLAQLMMTEFRPDIAAGLIVAVALYALINVEYASASISRLVLVGTLAAAAIVAKPTAFVATIPIVGFAAVIGLFRPGYYSAPAIRLSIRRAALALAISLTILVPVATILGPLIVTYAYSTLVTNRAIWETPGNAFFHWSYNSFGSGGHTAIGPFLYIGLFAIVIDAAISLKRWRDLHSYNALALYFVLILIYIGLALAPEKNVFQGSFFYLPFLLATVLAVSRILSRSSIRLSTVPTLPIGLALGLATTFLPTASQLQDSRQYPNANHFLAEISKEVTTRSLECDRTAPQVFATLTPYPITAEAVALSLALRNQMRVVPKALFMSNSLDELMGGAQSADFVLAPNKWGMAMQPNLPGFKFQSEATALLQADPGWKKIAISGPDAPTLYEKIPCR